MKNSCKLFIFLFAAVAYNQILMAQTLNLSSIGHYVFVPNKPVTIKNPLFWSVSATCTLTTQDASDTLSGKMLSGSGKLNGKDVGSGLSVQVKNDDKLKIWASGRAEVQITNLGQSPITANCGLGMKVN
mgnify:CR=1 FL=1